MTHARHAGRRLVDRLLPGRGAGRLAEHKQALERRRAELLAELAALETEKAASRERLHDLQVGLGARAGKNIQSRGKFEKTKGLPSLLVSHGAWQRIWAKTVELQGGRDATRDLFADPSATAAHAASHGIAVAPAGTATDVVAFTFRDRVGLLETGPDTYVLIDDEGRASAAGTGDADRAVLAADAPLTAEVVAASGRLGDGIPHPYVRIGWSLADGRPALTFVDVAPEQIPFVDHDHDRVLGDLHELALIKIQQGMIDRGALDIRVPGGTYVTRAER